MSSNKICFFSAMAVLSIIVFCRVGACQTSDPRSFQPSSRDTAATPGESRMAGPEDDRNDLRPSTLWRSYIWESLPSENLNSPDPDPVSEVYQQNDWQPLFVDSQFGLKHSAGQLLSRLRTLENEAIDPRPFRLSELSQSLEKLDRCRSSLKDVDPEIKDSRVEHISHAQPSPFAVSGPAKQSAESAALQKANTSTILKRYQDTFRAAGEADIRLTNAFILFTKEMNPFLPKEELTKAISGDMPISTFFQDLEPKTFNYEALRSAYVKYKKLAAMGPDQHGAKPSKGGNDDPGNHVGDSQKELPNVSFQQKADLIAYAMKAARQSPSRAYSRFIRINIPQFTLEYYKDGQLKEAHRIVVGKASGKQVKFRGRMVGENQTPTLSSHIEQVILNPRWYVSDRIRLELDSKAKSDPEWFAKHGYVSMNSRYPSGAPRLFQSPGPKNALGRVKFEFANPYAVYLHDTPLKQLFARSRRDFSHGCIRVDKALDLAETLLKDDGSPSASKMKSVLEGSRPLFVKLSQPIPISIEYIPVVATDSTRIVFLGDIYGILKQEEKLASRTKP